MVEVVRDLSKEGRAVASKLSPVFIPCGLDTVVDISPAIEGAIVTRGYVPSDNLLFANNDNGSPTHSQPEDLHTHVGGRPWVARLQVKDLYYAFVQPRNPCGGFAGRKL